MANYAYNWVNFSGEETQIKKVNAMFKAMQEKQKDTNEAQLPPFMTAPKEGYFFEIQENETDCISYTTRWSPNVLDLIEIANHFNLNFEVRYEESGNQIFGMAIFTAGNSEAEKYELEDSDYDLFSFDEETGMYTYEGEEWESDSEILESIFEKKFNFSY